jgi:hypothetical protein
MEPRGQMSLRLRLKRVIALRRMSLKPGQDEQPWTSNHLSNHLLIDHSPRAWISRTTILPTIVMA